MLIRSINNISYFIYFNLQFPDTILKAPLGLVKSHSTATVQWLLAVPKCLIKYFFSCRPSAPLNNKNIKLHLLNTSSSMLLLKAIMLWLSGKTIYNSSMVWSSIVYTELYCDEKFLHLSIWRQFSSCSISNSSQLSLSSSPSMH